LGAVASCKDKLPTSSIASEWDKFELKYYGPNDAIPFVVGELIKKGRESYAEVVKE
jgi:hypothetical protein